MSLVVGMAADPNGIEDMDVLAWARCVIGCMRPPR